MTELKAMIRRNNKLFLTDKGVFFTSLITPMILLVLYVSFLGNVYLDSFESVLTAYGYYDVPDKVMDGLVAGQLFSSLLAVCCVTVAFCSNMVMVTDKVTGARDDIMISPVKPSSVALSYYVSCFTCTLAVCLTATAVCFVYMAKAGWYLSIADVVLVLCDVLLLTMFGVALSSIINYFLSSQGQISAVGTIVSSGYGFICGAYMPISQFSEGLQKALSFLPGTHGTVLLRHHSMRGALGELENHGVAESVIDALADTMDCNLYFFETKVPHSVMYLVLGTTTLILILAYVLINKKRKI